MIASYTEKSYEMLEIAVLQEQIPVSYGKMHMPPVRPLLGERILRSHGHISGLILRVKTVQNKVSRS